MAGLMTGAKAWLLCLGQSISAHAGLMTATWKSPSKLMRGSATSTSSRLKLQATGWLVYEWHGQANGLRAVMLSRSQQQSSTASARAGCAQTAAVNAGTSSTTLHNELRYELSRSLVGKCRHGECRSSSAHKQQSSSLGTSL